MNEERFSGKAQLYAKFRPSYPTALVDWLYKMTNAENVADIGAGTGKFTEKLLAKPWSVTAVEPNTDMCRELLKCVGGRAEIVMASAESTRLPEHRFGLITAAQSFHWFDENKFREECRRLLTPDGRLAIVFNSRLSGAISVERDEIFRKYCPDFANRRSHMGVRSEEEGDKFLRNEYFSSVEMFQMENPVIFSREQFIGNSLSLSYSPKESDPNLKAFITEIRDLFDKYHRYGKVAISYKTTCYAGKF